MNISEKAFRAGNGTPVLRDVTFCVRQGEIVGVYGPSGCGKSTLLRVVAGFDRDYSGEVVWDDTRIIQPCPTIGVTSQEPFPYEWLTVRGNIAFGYRYRSNGTRGRTTKWGETTEVDRLAELVGLSKADLEKYPKHISGGMKQRMAFARALMAHPKVLLMDEPFGALDFEARESLQDVVLRIRENLGTAFVCVSHDPEEILYLADAIVILKGSPASIVESYRPEYPQRGSDEARYTPVFLEWKRRIKDHLTAGAEAVLLADGRAGDGRAAGSARRIR